MVCSHNIILGCYLIVNHRNINISRFLKIFIFYCVQNYLVDILAIKSYHLRRIKINYPLRIDSL